MLSGIGIVCFAASYLVSLVAEVSRLFFRAPVRMVVILGFSAAGLFAHTLYLIRLAHEEAGAAGNLAPLSSWFDWCLLAAWLLAAVYFALALRRSENALGVFLLPLVLALIGMALLLKHKPPFPRDEALGYWLAIHGLALLLGTVAVSLGFVAGLMYLAQSYRLKHKLPPRPGFRLPSLEWLQACNKVMLWVSTVFLMVGLIAGIVMNLVRGAVSVAWTDPVVVSSSVLCLWLVAASLFEWLYKPARQGRKVAYLTLAVFIFLALVLIFVLSGKHASRSPTQATQAPFAPDRIASGETVG